MVGNKTNKLLAARIEEHLKKNSKNPNASVCVRAVAEALQKSYPEYARKKKQSFTALVESIVIESGRKTVSASKHAAREQRRQESKVKGEEDDDDAELLYPTHNLNNRVLRNLYGPTVNGDGSDTANVMESDDKKTDEEPQKKQRRTTTGDASREMTRMMTKSRSDDWLAGIFEAEQSVPTLRYSDVGGYSRQQREIEELCSHLRDNAALFKRLHVKPTTGVLLHGPPGCGKTLMARATAGELRVPLYELAAPQLISGVSGDSEQRIRRLFEEAESRAPCVLFIDEIDAIATRRMESNKQMEARVVAQLMRCMDDLNVKANDSTETSEPRYVFVGFTCAVYRLSEVAMQVIGATSRLETIDPSLRRAGRFDEEVGLGIPDEDDRLQILQILTRDMALHDIDFETVVKMTPGYVGADLAALVRKASMVAVRRLSKVTNKDDDDQMVDVYGIEMSDFTEAAKAIRPSALREGFATVPDVKWSDVGALRRVREQLLWAIVYPVRHRQRFEAFGVQQAAQGVLLYGPPGCGKTLLAKAIANESCMNFISVKGPELLNMYVGESERGVRSLFQRAKNSAPCVIFFDELDALAPRRSDHEGSGGASARVVNQLLTEMDGIDTQRDERGGVHIMAATNRPDMIDPALLRPGRLDQQIYVGLPDDKDRADILKALTKDFTRPRFDKDVHIEEICMLTQNYTGADMASLLRETSVYALREIIKADPDGKLEESSDNVVHQRHFDKALKVVRPSVSDKQRRQYEMMRMNRA